MKILVTIKIIIDEKLVKDGKKNLRGIIDKIDESNISAAIEFKKRYTDTNITVVSISDRSNKNVLKYALAGRKRSYIFCY